MYLSGLFVVDLMEICGGLVSALFRGKPLKLTISRNHLYGI